MPTETIMQARQCLDTLRANVDAAFAYLHGVCLQDGTLAPQLLDQNQKVSYELAFCVAELEASAALLDYAVSIDTETDLCARVALVFCAETIRSTWQRLLSHAQELGLQSTELLTLMGTDLFVSFLNSHGDVKQLAEIGAEV